VPDIITLTQHLYALKNNLNRYRAKCARCGQVGLWCHGYYYRKPDRRRDVKSLNPIPIPRFICKHCGKTTSALPECIAPRRWYMWYIQQAALVQIISGKSLQMISKTLSVSRSTCRRWFNRFKIRYLLHGATLRNYYPNLGYHGDFNSFWLACLKKISLSKAMLLCNQSGVNIP
jgi:transposase